MRVGVIGCGNISGIYLQNMKTFEWLEVYACADLLREKAEEQAKKYGVPKVYTPEELFADKSIEIVLNLTIPAMHAQVALAALKSGKHVYSEKPLGINKKEAYKVIEMARKKGLRVGNAPDTFMGAGLQACRKIMDDGLIGKPIGGVAFMVGHGMETWHPNPEFYYQVGGGPMFDMGPYYITALVSLLGPAARVAGSTAITFSERLITSEPKKGQIIKVKTPTHITGIIDFVNGAKVTMIMSFDVWGASLPCMEIFGTEGSMSLPDPNTFSGPIKMYKPGFETWKDMPVTLKYSENSRGLGVADMAKAIMEKRSHRATGDMGYHVVEIMQSFAESSKSGKHIKIKSTCEKPQAM